MFYLVLGKGEITIVVETQDVKLGHLMFAPELTHKSLGQLIESCYIFAQIPQ